MENTADKISELLKEKQIEFKSSSRAVYSFFVPFEQDVRLKGCDVRIISENDKIRLCAELPIRIRRSEAVCAARAIAEKNEAMSEGTGYLLDPIKGTVQLIARYDMPDCAERLESMLEWAAQNMDEAVTLLMDTIHEAEARNRTFKNSRRSADEEQTWNAGTYEKYASREDWQGASPNEEYTPHEDPQDAPPHEGYTPHEDPEDAPPREGYTPHEDWQDAPPRYTPHGDGKYRSPYEAYTPDEEWRYTPRRRSTYYGSSSRSGSFVKRTLRKLGLEKNK